MKWKIIWNGASDFDVDEDGKFDDENEFDDAEFGMMG